VAIQRRRVYSIVHASSAMTSIAHTHVASDMAMAASRPRPSGVESDAAVTSISNGETPTGDSTEFQMPSKYRYRRLGRILARSRSGNCACAAAPLIGEKRTPARTVPSAAARLTALSPSR